MQPQPHQLGDPVLGVEHRAPSGLGGMRGDHRGHQRVSEGFGDCHRIQFRRVEFAVGGGQATVLRRLAGVDVDRATPFPVDVFGYVGQQREMAERPDHRDRLVDVDAVEHPGRLSARSISESPHPKRLDPGALDEVEHLVTVLFAHGVAEDGAEQPDVLAHRLGGLATDAGALYRTDRFQRGVGTSTMRPSIGAAACYRLARGQASAVLDHQPDADDRYHPDRGRQTASPGRGSSRTTVEPARLDWTPPPNSVDRPPPLARCSSTSSTTRRLVTTSGSAGPIAWPPRLPAAISRDQGRGPPAAIAQIVANCSPSSDAPPTSAPSTSSCATISPMFFAFTEPP